MTTDNKDNPVCVVCENRKVKHKHVICRSCHERQWHKMLTPEEDQRLLKELQYRCNIQKKGAT